MDGTDCGGLAMTSVAPKPGEPAVLLDRDVMQDDVNRTQDFHLRVKVLIEGSKDRAHIELPDTWNELMRPGPTL